MKKDLNAPPVEMPGPGSAVDVPNNRCFVRAANPNPNPEFIKEFNWQVNKCLLDTTPLPCEGRGIVICGGGWSMLAGIYVTASMLRWECINSRLPIEVWCIGDNGELDPIFPHLTRHLNVTWRDASEELRKRGIVRKEKLKGWAIKPLALSLCSFAEVCMMDADCYPTYDPERLMDDPVIKEKGAAFWADIQGDRTGNHQAGNPLTTAQWSLFGMDAPDRQTPGFESGQMIVNKSRHPQAVRLLAWLSDRFGEFDATRGKAGGLHGDKDVFSVAFRAAASDCWIAPPVKHAAPALLQHDRRGYVAFVHRCQDKLRLTRGWIQSPNKLQHTNQLALHLPHEELVHKYLDELRHMLRPDIPGFRDGTQDEQIVREIIANTYRLPEVMDGWRVVDVGGHIGLFSLDCLNRGAAVVVAAEPFPPNAMLFCLNLAAYQKRCCLHQKAVAAPGVSQVGIRASVNSPSMTAEPHVHPDGVPAPTITLDEMIVECANGGRVDLLKLDCEGGEYPAILTATRLDLVDRIALEWHSCNATGTPEQLAAKLEAEGFVVEWSGKELGIGGMFASRK